MEGEWVDRLERRLGFLAAPGLPTFVTGMTVVCAFLSTYKPEFIDLLYLDPAALLRGQVWRVVTFLFVPPPAGPLWLVLWIIMLYAILRALETAWGDFKFTFFILIGLFATSIGALAARVPFGNTIVILSCFLAFARLMPDREVLVMFVLPVKLRWLAGLAGLWVVVGLILGPMEDRVRLACGLAPYVLFFGSGHVRDLKLGWHHWRHGDRF